LLERYLSAAEKISRLAVGRVGRSPGGETFRVAPDLTQEEHLEGLALGTFINVRASTSCELLRQVLTYVIKDEARHVAFGNLYLTAAIADMHPDDRAEVEDFALEMMRRLLSMRRGADSMRGFDQVLVDTGVDPDDFVRALHEEIRDGFKLDSPPGSVHSFRGLILPGIVRAGLASERVRAEYEAAEIRLFSDTALLEELEESGGISGRA